MMIDEAQANNRYLVMGASNSTKSTYIHINDIIGDSRVLLVFVCNPPNVQLSTDLYS